MLVQIVIFTLLFSSYTYCSQPTVNGRYTRDIADYVLLVPHKRSANGNFATFYLPHFFSRSDSISSNLSRKTREIQNYHVLYGIVLDGKTRHLQLWPSNSFVSPDALLEKRDNKESVGKRFVKKIGKRMCYYNGKIKDSDGSRVALSACDGLIGYIIMDGRVYYIEPMMDHKPNKRGQLVHIIYEKKLSEQERKKRETRCVSGENWEQSWKDVFRREYFEKGALPTITTHSRSIESRERWIETLVVCDKKFIEHHRGTDIELYVMTIMNMVADYYRDASTGHELEIVVVRIMFLEKEEQELDLIINPNAEKTLESFCKWQVHVNPVDDKNPNHHDIAVLLTRYDICSNNMAECSLLGLAYVGTPCTTDKNCAINEDAGLQLGVVVAHEMGHVMGCSHDKEDISGCKSQAEDGSFFVMSPYVHLDTNVWSACSKKFMRTLFENNLGECLNDEPQDTLYKFDEMLPGAVYDANYQCNITFPGSTICQQEPENFCKMLLCKTSPTSCSSLNEPPADGTKCGENKWCYDNKCIEAGTRPDAVNGGWGDWGEWSECSRTCGGGVMASERFCNNPTPKHKGRYCLGVRKRFKLCNTDACPRGTKSFRAEQCSQHDSKPFQGKLYTWTPYYVEASPCVLYCFNKEFYTKLEERVIDGTKCRKGSKDMCIGGVCRKVGCDWVLDSDAVEDICGTCKGDGTQCKIIEAVYKDPPGNGYTKVIMIPKGARNVLIQELGPSTNTIAITAADETTFFLNGNNQEQANGEYKIGGVEGVYSHPEPEKEMLTITGPLQEEVVFFVVFYKPENIGYKYRWAEPGPQNSYLPRYHWEITGFSKCNVNCNGGVQTSTAACFEDKAGRVDDSFCDPVDKPSVKTRKCNTLPCKTRWKVGHWSTCSGCKFRCGLKTREVSCVREPNVSGQSDVSVDDSNCKGIKPASKELCNSLRPCVRQKKTDSLSNYFMEDIYKQTKIPYYELKPTSFHLVTFQDFNKKQLNHLKNEQFEMNTGDLMFSEYRTKKDVIERENYPYERTEKYSKRNRYNFSPYRTNVKKLVNKQNGNNFKDTYYRKKSDNTNPNEAFSSRAVSAAKLFGKSKTSSANSRNSSNCRCPCLPLSETTTVCSTTEISAVNPDDEKLPIKDRGSVVKDHVDPNEFKVISIPLKQSNQAIDLSDESFQSVGDIIPDTVEKCKETVVTGKDAEEALKKLKETNATLQK